jgi:hypothetical protein
VVISKLQYCEGFSIGSGAAGNIGTYVFRANSIYDPNLTGGGHQPMGRDLLAGLYNHYTVLSSKIVAYFCPVDVTNAAIPNILGIYLNEDSTTTATYAVNLIEQSKHCVWAVRGANSFLNGDGKPTVLRNSFNAASYFGLSDPLDDKSTVGAAQGANPTEDADYILFVQPAYGGTQTAAFTCIVQIEYEVAFTEPIEQSAN